MLNWCRVFELCDTFPDLRFSLNGGVKTLELAQKLLSGEWREAEDPRVTRCLSGGYESADGLQVRKLHGVMIGRAAMNDPCCLAQTDKLIYGRVLPRERR